MKNKRILRKCEICGEGLCKGDGCLKLEGRYFCLDCARSAYTICGGESERESRMDWTGIYNIIYDRKDK